MFNIKKEDILAWREKVTGTYAWDFCLCEGETITEKYQSLLNIVQTFAVKSNECSFETMVFASNIISSCLAVCYDFKDPNITPFYKEVSEGVKLLQSVKRTCGSNGYNTNYHLYSCDLPVDEVLVVNENNKSQLIKLFNLVT